MNSSLRKIKCLKPVLQWFCSVLYDICGESGSDSLTGFAHLLFHCRLFKILNLNTALVWSTWVNVKTGKESFFFFKPSALLTLAVSMDHYFSSPLMLFTCLGCSIVTPSAVCYQGMRVNRMCETFNTVWQCVPKALMQREHNAVERFSHFTYQY